MNSQRSQPNDGVQQVNWPGTSTSPAAPPPPPPATEPGEAELVELELESYSAEIHPAHDHVDLETYGGGFDLTRRATAPKLRVGRDKWFNLLWLIPIGFALLVTGVAAGKGLHHMPAVQAFIERYPGVDT